MLRPTDIDVRTVMSTEVFRLPLSSTLTQASEQLLQKGLSGAPVVEGEQLRGEVDVKDLLRAMVDGRAGSTPLSELLREATTCDPGTHLTEACKQMIRARAHRIVAIEGGALVGLVAAIDVVRALAALDPKAIRWNPLTQTIELAEE